MGNSSPFEACMVMRVAPCFFSRSSSSRSEASAVFPSSNERDEGLDGGADFGSESIGEFGVTKRLPDGLVVFAAPVGGKHGGGLADATVRCVEHPEERHIRIR